MNDSALLATIAATLEGLGIGMCVFDDDDCTVLWNRIFLEFFPEHDGHVHVGEPYRENLRRYYQGRLNADEMPKIERYVEEGVARHRAQSRPFAFAHRGRYLRVSSLRLAGGGRIRIWIDESSKHPPVGDAVRPLSRPQEPFFSNADAFDHVPDGVAVAEPSGMLAWVNHAFVVMYGLPDWRAATGQTLVDVYQRVWEHARIEQHEPYERGLTVLAENMRFAGAPFEVPLPDGRWSRVIEQRGPQGSRVFAHVDITELKRQQRSLQQAEARARDSERLLAEKSAMLEATLERMDQGVVMVNAERTVEVCNRRAIELLGLPESMMTSRPSFESVLSHQWDQDEFRLTSEDILNFVRAGGILDRPHRYDRRRPDGRVIEVQSVPIDGGGVLRTYTDITERKRNEERMQHVARHDGLTSLVNRAVFLEHLAGATIPNLQSMARFAVHYIDLDRFKPVNDTYGHAAGDQVLTEIAARIRVLARDADIVARLGGDEFAVLQRGADRPENALGLAHRILQTIAQPIVIDGVSVHVGASIGVALFPADGETADALVRHADAAMYAAKASGRDAVKVYSEIKPPAA
ncbi:MAG TPA: PAS-domain containing protein [Burkholderiaceae bacterium]|nr:PAS-domain containing protein [Burkholderiaceae bacterium]